LVHKQSRVEVILRQQAFKPKSTVEGVVLQHGISYAANMHAAVEKILEAVGLVM
ncbi:unnamed protein product, partial [Effrenium voratum]